MYNNNYYFDDDGDDCYHYKSIVPQKRPAKVISCEQRHFDLHRKVDLGRWRGLFLQGTK